MINKQKSKLTIIILKDNFYTAIKKTLLKQASLDHTVNLIVFESIME